ncbi:MAG: response regulator [Chitinophagaceae bacterium]|nr:response regulator [Chitinophagaceae bacterium]
MSGNLKILLIEDDLDDVELLEEALKTHSVSYSIEVITDGSDALNHIKSSDARPDIVILDLNLPKVHGRQLILELKSSKVHQDIPLLILTTSSAKEDIDYSYSNGADKFLIKPTTLEKIKETVDTILSLTRPRRINA